MSEVLNARLIEAHENLWSLTIHAYDDLPSPYGMVLGLFNFTRPSELRRIVDDSPHLRGELGELPRLTDYLGKLNDVRPFIDDDLWNMVFCKLAFLGRLLILLTTNEVKDAPAVWSEDDVIRRQMLSTFTENEVETMLAQDLPYRSVVETWDSRIAARIRARLSLMAAAEA